MELFRGIHEAVRDKSADKLYAHLLNLGLQAELMRGNPLQKVGAIKGKSKSLGLIQVSGKNIGCVNMIKERRIGEEWSIFYYLDYIVPLKEIPSILYRASVETKTKGFFRDKVVDIKWRGHALADALNDDLNLKQDLLMEYRLNWSLSWITIIPAPAYQCARIETNWVLPSNSLFDCLERIAGHVIEVNKRLDEKRPDEVLLEVKVELNPQLKDAEVAQCYVTYRHVLIKSREPLQIPLCQVEDCNFNIPTLLGAPTSVHTRQATANSVVTLKYRDASGQRRTMEFAMNAYDARRLREVVLHP